MHASLSYGDRYTVCYRARNGVGFRLAIQVAGYDGPPVELLGVSSVVLRRSSQDMFAPLVPSVLRVSLPPRPRDRRAGTADLAALGGLPDGAVHVTLRADLDGDAPGGPDIGPAPYEVSLFEGYMLPEALVDLPENGLGMIEFQASCGTQHLVNRPAVDPASDGYDPAEERTVVDWLRGMLAEIASADGQEAMIVTSTDWRPWVPGGEVADTTDPLAALRLRAEAFANENLEGMDQAAALRALCARFGARLMQAPAEGEPAWHVLQRGYLARTQALGVARWSYPLSGPGGGPPDDADMNPGTRTVADRVRDTLAVERGGFGGGVLAGAQRQRGQGYREVSSAYDFRPELDSVVVNGSFEAWVGVPYVTEVAEGWSYTEDLAERTLVTGVWADDQYAMVLRSEDGGARGVTEQATGAVVPVSAGWRMEAAWTLLTYYIYYEAVEGHTGTPAPLGGLALNVGGFAVRQADVTTVLPSLQGDKLTVAIQPLTTGTLETAGTEIIPVGTTILFRSTATWSSDVLAELTLSRPGRVGDRYLVGQLSFAGSATRMNAGAVGSFWYWAETDDAEPVTGRLRALNEFDDVFDLVSTSSGFTVAGTTPEGKPVAGPVRVALYGLAPVVDGAVFVDDVALRVAANDSAGREAGLASSIGVRAMLPAGAGGALAVSLPTADPGGHAVGDGPMPDSATRLRVRAESGGVYDTGGWKRGAYAPAEASSGASVDELAACEALAQLAGRPAETGGPERWRGALALPHLAHADDLPGGGAPPISAEDCLWWPQDAYRLYQPCRIAQPAVAGADYVVLTAPPKPGQPIIIDFKGASALGVGGEETHYVGAVTAGAGSYTATLVDADGDPAVLAHSHARHTECRYGLVALADTSEWNTGEAVVTLEATDLAWRDPDGDGGPAFITESTLNT